MAVCMLTFGYGQNNSKISTIDFVQVVDNNKEETLFYYENNWKVLRDVALEKNYIHSYQLLETQLTEKEPFQLMLITTYINGEQHEQAEERFGKLIAQQGQISLMNEKKPDEFRKVLFSKLAEHLH